MVYCKIFYAVNRTVGLSSGETAVAVCRVNCVTVYAVASSTTGDVMDDVTASRDSGSEYDFSDFNSTTPAEDKDAFNWFLYRVRSIDYKNLRTTLTAPVFTARRYSSAVYVASVRPSVTSRYSVKTAKHRITQKRHTIADGM